MVHEVKYFEITVLTMYTLNAFCRTSADDNTQKDGEDELSERAQRKITKVSGAKILKTRDGSER